MSEFEEEFADDDEGEFEEEDGDETSPRTYDPARRKLYDPGRRRGKKHKKGRMPAGLRRYWAAKKARKMDPARKHRRHSKRRHLDPARRGKRGHRVKHVVFDPGRRRRRRYDPGIAGTNTFLGALLQPVVTTLGGIIHNALVKKPALSGATKIGNSAVGHLGLVGGITGAVLDLAQKPSLFGSMANSFGSGMLTEAVNLPAVEGIATMPTIKAAAKSGQAVETGVGASSYITQPHKLAGMASNGEF